MVPEVEPSLRDVLKIVIKGGGNTMFYNVDEMLLSADARTRRVSCRHTLNVSSCWENVAFWLVNRVHKNNNSVSKETKTSVGPE